MAEGWIKIYRNIQEHWIWQDPQKLKWWLDILLLANHKDNKFLLGNELITIERGEHHTSELKLAERWGVSKTTVRKFLKLLESDNMIELKKSKKGTTLKVTNYNDYQDFSEGEKTIKKPQKNHSVDHKETIKEPYAIPQKNHEVYTNNNEKNDKNENNDNKNNYMSDSNEYRLAEYLYKHIKANNPNAKEPNFQNWAKTFDYILRIDKRDLEEVKQLIVFCQKHSFWYKNILSADKFRKQYERLLLEKNDSKKVKYENVYGNKMDEFNNHPQRNYNFEELEKKLLGWQDEESEEQT